MEQLYIQGIITGLLYGFLSSAIIAGIYFAFINWRKTKKAMKVMDKVMEGF